MIFAQRRNTAFIGHAAHLFPGAVFRLRRCVFCGKQRFWRCSRARWRASTPRSPRRSASTSNAMGNDAQREQLRKLNGESCNRGGSEDALRITLGKRTSECSYRTPVIGRDLEIAATARLLSGTPKALRKKAFLAVDLRAGEQGAHYQLAVYPLQRKAQLRTTLPDGSTRYLKIAKGVGAIKGINEPNELAAASLQCHQRPGQRLLSPARLRRQRTRRRRDRRRGRRPPGSRLLDFARGLEVSQGPGRELRRRRRPGPEPVRIGRNNLPRVDDHDRATPSGRSGIRAGR